MQRQRDYIHARPHLKDFYTWEYQRNPMFTKKLLITHYPNAVIAVRIQ